MRLPSASRWAAWPVQLRTAALQEAADGGIGFQADRPLGGGGSLSAGSHHPIARFAAPTSWPARRVGSGSG
jgi:hypothetical protein